MVGQSGHGNSQEYRESSQVKSPDATGIDTFIPKGVTLSGKLNYRGTLRLDGILEGEVHIDGCLLVGEDAVVTAKVSAASIICRGTILGELVASEKVLLLSPAILNGSVIAPRVSIEAGVEFDGKLTMIQNSLHLVPPVESETAHGCGDVYDKESLAVINASQIERVGTAP